MKIKKVVLVVLCIAVCSCIPACGGEGNAVSSGKNGIQNSVEDVLQSGMQAEDNKQAVEDSAETADNYSDEVKTDNSEEAFDQPETVVESVDIQKEAEPSADGIDIDLTTMSSTMVYSEVYDMMYYPEKYMGKRVKINGLFATYHDEETGKDYFACIVSDATACCSQGIEFEPEGDCKYPEDYPKEGEEVTVVGVFDTYTEGESQYCTLRNAEMI